MDKKQSCKNKRKEEKVSQLDSIKEEIKENYKIGIDYYQDVEEHQDE